MEGLSWLEATIFLPVHGPWWGVLLQSLHFTDVETADGSDSSDLCRWGWLCDPRSPYRCLRPHQALDASFSIEAPVWRIGPVKLGEWPIKCWGTTSRWPGVDGGHWKHWFQRATTLWFSRIWFLKGVSVYISLRVLVTSHRRARCKKTQCWAVVPALGTSPPSWQCLFLLRDGVCLLIERPQVACGAWTRGKEFLNQAA